MHEQTMKTLKPFRILIWIFVIGIIIFYFGCDSNRSENKKKEDESPKHAELVRTELSKMVYRNKAIVHWERELLLNRGTYSRVYSADLENAWIGDQPILFIGKIKNILNYNQDEYSLEIEREVDEILNLTNSGFNSISLSVHYGKRESDIFLKEHADVSNILLPATIGIIATISEIKTKEFINNDGEREWAHIGIGKIIEIMYIGHIKVNLKDLSIQDPKT